MSRVSIEQALIATPKANIGVGDHLLRVTDTGEQRVYVVKLMKSDREYQLVNIGTGMGAYTSSTVDGILNHVRNSRHKFYKIGHLKITAEELTEL